MAAHPVDYLRAKAGDIRSTGDLERTILALAGAGVGTREFRRPRPRRRASRPAQRQRLVPEPGQPDGVRHLRPRGVRRRRLRARPFGHLAAQARRTGDGGWGFQPGQPSEADSTGAALQGLAAAGSGGDAAAHGARFLGKAQGRDGGWALAESGPTNSQSTAWAVQGLLAANRDPASVTRAGHSAFDYLDARQSSDGHYRYSAASDQTPVWVTGQVLIAVSRDTFPIAAVPRAPNDAASGSGGGGGTAGDGPGARSSPADGAQPDERDRPARPGAGVESESVSGNGSRGTPAPEFEQTSSEDDGPSTPQVVLGGLGLLAVLLAGGFFLYRRHLPM